MHGIDC
jgi:uncharacterized protein